MKITHEKLIKLGFKNNPDNTIFFIKNSQYSLHLLDTYIPILTDPSGNITWLSNIKEEWLLKRLLERLEKKYLDKL